jgi:uncharacterized protein (DUF736 family)
MALTIGTFTETDAGFSGRIITKELRFERVQFRRIEKRSSDDAPNFKITAEDAHIGGAWQKAGKQHGTVYYSVQLDDPSLEAAINCSLFQSKDEPGTWELVWSRPS